LQHAFIRKFANFLIGDGLTNRGGKNKSLPFFPSFENRELASRYAVLLCN